MPDVTLHAADAAELAEMLQLFTGWLARDPARLAASLEDFTGHPPTASKTFAATWSATPFLLGGSDGESLCGPPRQ